MLLPDITHHSEQYHTVTVYDSATYESLVMYAGPSRFLAAEAHRYLSRFVKADPAATLADVREVFHTEED